MNLLNGRWIFITIYKLGQFVDGNLNCCCPPAAPRLLPIKMWRRLGRVRLASEVLRRLTTTFYFPESVRLTDILAICYGQFLQLWFCSVRSPCITEAIHWSHPLHRAETELLWKFGVNTYRSGKIILKFSSVTLLQCPCWKLTIYHVFVDILSRYALFWWLVPEKIALCLQCSGTKYRYFIWAKRSTALGTVMVHSAHSIALLLASFDVALPSECEKQSWINWTIVSSPSTCWVLLCWFLVRRSRFQASHHATFWAWRSLTSKWPVMHTCSHFGARVLHSERMLETSRAQPQVPQHFDCARVNQSLLTPPVALLRFTSYGADLRTQEP